MPKKFLTLIAFAAILSAAFLMVGAPAQQADAAAAIAACPNPGYYTGTSTSGSFQGALDDAISEAETCAGCCDMLVTWDFVSADGREGGFAGFNEVNVTIKASW